MPKKDELTRQQALDNYFIDKLYEVVDTIIDKSRWKSRVGHAKFIHQKLITMQTEYEAAMIEKCAFPSVDGESIIADKK